MQIEASTLSTLILKFIGGTKMKQLGISIYPDRSGQEETKAYVSQASQYGFTRIFTYLRRVILARLKKISVMLPVMQKYLGWKLLLM